MCTQRKKKCARGVQISIIRYSQRGRQREKETRSKTRPISPIPEREVKKLRTSRKMKTSETNAFVPKWYICVRFPRWCTTERFWYLRETAYIRDVERSSFSENFEDADSKVDKYCQKDYFKTPRATDAQYLEYQEKRVEVRSCIQCILLRSLLERKLFASISPLDKYLSIFRARRSSIVPFFKGLYARTTKFSETILTCCRAVSRPSWTFRWRPCRWRRRWSFGRFGLGQWIAWC